MKRSESSSEVSTSQAAEQSVLPQSVSGQIPAKPARAKFQRSEYSSRPDLLSRGWTDSMIDALLPVPDCTKRNPRFRCAGDMRFFSNQRVLIAEQSDEFQRRKVIAESRGKAARDAANRRREATEECVMTPPPPQVLKQPYHVVCKKAYRSWSARWLDRGEFTDPFESIDELTLKRIVLNYIRHELSDYDELLDSVKGVVGADAARSFLRAKVMEAISAAYPELAGEVHDHYIKELETESIL